MTATVRDFKGKAIPVKVGDVVGFKSDYEQYGGITKIERNNYNGRYMLHLHNDSGFGGEYPRHATDTVKAADDCWID